jgi:hypothetical protein
MILFKKEPKMKQCIRCKSERIISVNGKTSDCFSASYKGEEFDGYVLSDVGIGEGGDYIEISYCLDCGQIQDKFPIDEELVLSSIKGE